MARQLQVILDKKWSDWNAGDVVTLEAAKARRVVGKGYGRIATKKALADLKKQPDKADDGYVEPKGPAVETATAPPAGENADTRPQPEPSAGQSSEKDGD